MMMKAIIHFEYPNGTADSLCLEGDLEAIREQAVAELAQRGVSQDTAWSEVIEE